MDNLIAQRKITAMIVVMPNAHWNNIAALDAGGPSAAPAPPGSGGPPAAGAVTDNDRAEREIIGDIIPLVEKRYRTLTGRENRAIAGFSMGVAIAFTAGLALRLAWLDARPMHHVDSDGMEESPPVRSASRAPSRSGGPAKHRHRFRSR